MIKAADKRQEAIANELKRLQGRMQQLETELQQLHNGHSEEGTASAVPGQESYNLLCLHDMSGRIIRVNDEVEQIFNVYEKDGTFLNLRFLLSPDVRAGFEQYLQSFQLNEEAHGIMKAIDAKGNIRFIAFRATLVQRAEPYYIRCEARDISRRFATHYDYDFYKNLFEHNRTPIILVSANGLVLDANQATASFFSISRENILGMQAESIFAEGQFQDSTLDFAIEEALSGKSARLNWHGDNGVGRKVVVQIGLSKTVYYMQEAIAFYIDDISADVARESAVISNYNELRVVKETLRHLSGLYKVNDILMAALAKLFELDYLQAAGYYQVSSNNYFAWLKFHINLSTDTLEHLQHIQIDSYPSVFYDKQSFELPPGTAGASQAYPLIIIPVTVENKVTHAFLLELQHTRVNAGLLINLLGAEISSFVTQAQLNNKLVQSETRFRIIADNSPSLLRTTDASNQFVFFSKQWLIFTGRTINSQIGMGWLSSVHPDDIAILQHNMQKAFEQRERFEISYRLRNKSGQYYWMLDNGTPYYDQQGEFRGYICSAVDITEQKEKEKEKHKEAALRYSQEGLETALVKSPVFAFTVDKNGELSFVNEALKRRCMGIAPLTGQHFSSVFRPTQLIGNDTVFLPANFIDTFEGHIIVADGEEIQVRLNAIAWNDRSGSISAITVMAEDITEKQRVQQALAESNRMLQDLFDNATDLVQILTADERFYFVNNAWKKTLEYSEEEAQKLYFYSLVHPEYRERTRRVFERVARTGTPENFETAFVTRHGRKIDLTGSLSCDVAHDGKPRIFRAILHDITERIRAEKAQALYYRIARLTESSTNLESLYHNFYVELNKTIEVESFLIALQSDRDSSIYYPYFVNSDHAPDEGIQGRVFAEYAISFDRPMFFYGDVIERILTSKQIAYEGAYPKVWMGVPLKLESKIIGIIIVQSFRERNLYNKRDLELLSFISGQLVSAIQRNQNQEKINEQAIRLQAVFESGSHMMWSVNKELRITRFNRNYANSIRNLYNIAPHSGMEITEIYTSSNKEQVYFWLNKYRLALAGHPQHFERRLYGRKGEEVWHEIFLNPIVSSNSFEVDEVSGVALDITAKKLSEFSLAESEEKFRNIFESFQDMYIRADLDGIITMISPSARDLLGEEPYELQGRGIAGLVVARENLESLLSQLKEKGFVKNYESSLIDSFGHIRNIISNFRLMYDHAGRPFALECVARDITELTRASEEIRKAKEFAERSLEVKKRFLSNMSHEIRTPMNGIIGMIDLLSESENLEEEHQMYISTVKKSSETLLNILNDILDLSKIEAGKMELRKLPVSLPGIIDKLYALFSQRALQNDVTLAYEIASEVPVTIMADETRLLQILSNLTSNALKFTEKGGIRIKVSTLPTDEEPYYIKIEVIDSGIGISKENQDLLFQTFTQVDNTYTKSYGGTGLGLAISQELCRLMGGEIGVQSVLGEGSNFWFTFKAEKCDPSLLPNPDSLPKEPPITGQLSSSPAILIVDDNAVNLNVARSILKKAGCRVDTAQSGREAIELVQQKSYDLIFMDVQMPVMNGITATQKIRELDLPKYPPVVAMTAFSLQEERESFLNAGMDDYIAKPIKAQVLIAKVKHWVEEKEIFITVENNMQRREPSSQHTATLLINQEALAQLRKYGGDELVELSYTEFEQESELLVSECRQLIAEKHYREALVPLHTLKGNSATLGLEQIASLAAHIEHCIKTDDYNNVAHDFRLLEVNFQQFKKHYRAFLNLPHNEAGSATDSLHER